MNSTLACGRWSGMPCSECRYRGYVERSPAAFYRNTLDGRILDCNDSMARMLGYGSPAELRTHRISELYAYPLDRIALLEKLRAQGSLQGLEISLKRKDGSTLWVLSDLTLVTENGEVLVEGNAIDITPRKRMEKELRSIAALVEASSDFVGFASLEGEVQFINRAGRRFLGLDPESPLAGRRVVDDIAEEDRQSFAESVLPAVAREGRWEGETRFRNIATGAVIPMWQSVFYVTDPETQQPIALATVCRDLTERKRQEDEMRAAQHAAEAGSRAKSRFLANMSHEIRTPMNGILGMTRLLLGTELSAEQRHYAQVVLSSGDGLLTLINRVLDLSKIEAGKISLDPVDFDLDRLLHDTTGALALEAHGKGLEFKLTVDPRVPRRLRGDAGRLRQVMGNLAANAIKFTSRGSVRIAVGLDGEEERTATLRFTVRDTGIGIAPELARKLFSPFVQADESTTRKFGGTGLGLSISKQLAELMGGQIGFESAAGQGASFWFTAVLEKQAESARAAPPVDGASCRWPLPSGCNPRRNARILLAEDHPVNRDVMLAMLEQFGYQADSVENGREALEVLQARRYALVLMDCQMPQMDGYEATRRIRDERSGALDPRVAIVAVTASAMAGDREKCLAAGMDDYLPKPVDPDSLHHILDKWLRGVRQDAPAVPSAPPPAALAAVVFDRAALLKRLMGREALARKVVQAFLDAAPGQLERLRDRTAVRDGTAARREAHTLKGAAATVSAPALRGLALEAEQAAAAGEWNRLEAILPGMEEQLVRLQRALENEGGPEREARPGPLPGSTEGGNRNREGEGRRTGGGGSGG